MQCPYYLVHALTLVFNLPEEKCRVIQTETGGAFGGKEDFPSVIGSHAALLAMKSGIREDDLRPRGGHGGDDEAASFAHAAPNGGIEGRQAARRARLRSRSMAARTRPSHAVVLSRATIHAPGPYNGRTFRVRAKAMATNIAAAWGVSRVRRAAIAVRARTAHGQGCEGRGA